MGHSSHKKTSVMTGGDSLLEKMPENIMFDEILSKLDETETLTMPFSLTCVSRTLQSTVNNYLFSLSSLDLSAFSMYSHTVNGITKRCGNIKRIKLDCLRLDELFIRRFLEVYVEELILLKASSLSYDFLSDIANCCPNLRVLTVELSDNKRSIGFENNLNSLLMRCPCLETLEIKVHMRKRIKNGYTIPSICHKLPQTIKVLKLDMRVLLGRIIFGPTLTHISLVLNLITNAIVRTIVQSCPLLAELELIDIPKSNRFYPDELSHEGIQSLVACKHLTSLSLIRSCQLIHTALEMTDTDMILLSEGCKGLESLKLHGFNCVGDVGFASIFNSCLKLTKLEIKNAFLMKTLAFENISKVHRSLAEVKLISCSSITSKAVHKLVTSCTSLKVLDLFGCERVADSCLSNISCLTLLTSLNLGCTNVTDAGMVLLGKANAPISCLSLRGCNKVTDKGITFLLTSGGKICKTLSSLDLGHLQKITDNAITIVANACAELIELCIRNCLLVTDEAVKVLAVRGRLQDEIKFLRRLDISKCPGISFKSFEYLKKPLFHGLQWIGIGETRLICIGDVGLGEIRERPGLTICKDCCELGCRDGWQNHYS
ncbi:F-box domain, cyclin-like protein [Artemisia annua]|uniref:F-box domain, cyclin-like protein n=1 Tax=Artemisia annua TaxID=35608 RepID=A0A2U1PI92_ARTAN|nr:F-box domain, cyclin-like protein [Artemisia annua]